MREIKGNMFNILNNFDVACITTNGMVKKNGCAVMGAGVAKQINQIFPGTDKILGNAINKKGNVVLFILKLGSCKIMSFPVKHNWWEEADLKLIEKSAKELIDYVDRKGFESILVPRPGCGNGKLYWKDVKKVLDSIFDDRFYIINN